MTTDTLTIVKPSSPAKPELGSILHGASFLSELISNEDAKKLKVLSLANSHNNHWKALEKIGIDATELRDEVEYECPFRKDAKFYKVYPLAISKLFANEAGEELAYIFSKDPDTDFFHREPGIDDVDQSFMGHGYDSYILPYDGHGKWKYAKIDLSDGRWLIAAYFEWYNK